MLVEVLNLYSICTYNYFLLKKKKKTKTKTKQKLKQFRHKLLLKWRNNILVFCGKK